MDFKWFFANYVYRFKPWDVKSKNVGSMFRRIGVIVELLWVIGYFVGV